eukprot:COSAG06_NODE_43384_length_372_cov_1.249084_1_plen_108_part_10
MFPKQSPSSRFWIASLCPGRQVTAAIANFGPREYLPTPTANSWHEARPDVSPTSREPLRAVAYGFHAGDTSVLPWSCRVIYPPTHLLQTSTSRVSALALASQGPSLTA